MRLHVLSDLHLEVAPFAPVSAGADAVVVAGDVDSGAASLEWLRRAFPHSRIVFVPGNHEYYAGEFETCGAAMRRAADALGIDLLDDSAVEIAGVRFVGATLWTDLMLYGPRGRDALLARGLERLVEYRTIRVGDAPFTPAHTVAFHQASRAFLERALAEDFPGRTVVITHHGPHPLSIAERFAGSVVNPSFISDLSALMGPAALWIHGHTHASSDYVVNGTRVVANPRGYAGRHPVSGRPHGTPERPENPAFDPGLVVEV
ncbi:MAG: metallophosphoesterase family protein [Burkholderiales bacterium]|nr:metallophosphoesterase family protein [Burkholderiales bacterium]